MKIPKILSASYCSALVLLLISVSLLNGCGFRLAQTEFGTLVEQGVQIEAPNSYLGMKNAVQKLLKSAGIKNTGHWHVEILSVQKNETVLVSNRRQFDTETLMYLKMQFKITNPAGKIFPERQISASRRLSQNPSRLNVATALEEFYYRELEQELAQRLLSDVAFLSKANIAPPP